MFWSYNMNTWEPARNLQERENDSSKHVSAKQKRPIRVNGSVQRSPSKSHSTRGRCLGMLAILPPLTTGFKEEGKVVVFLLGAGWSLSSRQHPLQQRLLFGAGLISSGELLPSCCSLWAWSLPWVAMHQGYSRRRFSNVLILFPSSSPCLPNRLLGESCLMGKQKAKPCFVPEIVIAGGGEVNPAVPGVILLSLPLRISVKAKERLGLPSCAVECSAPTTQKHWDSNRFAAVAPWVMLVLENGSSCYPYVSARARIIFCPPQSTPLPPSDQHLRLNTLSLMILTWTVTEMNTIHYQQLLPNPSNPTYILWAKIQSPHIL